MKIQKIEVTDLFYKPTIEFYNIQILDKVFTGIKKAPSIYVIKFSDRISSSSEIDGIEFDWNGIHYELIGVYEHTTKDKDWRIIECQKWFESKI